LAKAALWAATYFCEAATRQLATVDFVASVDAVVVTVSAKTGVATNEAISEPATSKLVNFI
jgi:hypothetical protein